MSTRAVGCCARRHKAAAAFRARLQRGLAALLLLLLWLAVPATAGEAATDAAAAGGDGDAFYFVQVTDTHFGSKDYLWRLRKSVERINALPMPIEFVAHTGDIMMENMHDRNLVTNCLNLLGRLEAPVYFVPGNHDLPRGRLETALNVYTNRFGDLIHQRDCRGVAMLFVYTEPLAKGFSVRGYDPLAGLERRLQGLAGRPAIVFHHTPCVEDFYRNRLHRGWPAEARRAWVALLNRYNVKAVLAGHFHRDEHHWLDRVPLYVSAPVVGYWDRQATFRVFEYRAGRLSYRTQYIR